MMQLAVVIIATILVIGWIFLMIRYGESFTDESAGIDKEVYQMPEMFFVGFGIMDAVHFNMYSKRARQRIHEIAEVNGKKCAEYYFYEMTGAKFTYAYCILLVFFLLAAVSAAEALALVGVVFAFLAAVIVL